MKRSVKAVIGAGALGGAVLTVLFGYALYTGPRMKVQPHLRAYQAVMPLPVAGTVPVGPSPYIPAARTAATSYAPDSGAATRGAVYYAYYCLFCHGESGKGNGPVGEAYVPTPADLSSPRVAGLEPEQLHRAMLTGTGHNPVLERVVRPGYRWDLVSYVRTLSRR